MFALADTAQALGASPDPPGVAGQAPGAGGQDDGQQATDKQVIDRLSDGSPAVATNAAGGEGWPDWAVINLQRLSIARVITIGPCRLPTATHSTDRFDQRAWVQQCG